MTKTRNILGYAFSAHFNDSYAFRGRSDVRRCPACGNFTNKWEESLEGLRISKRRRYDISATYDGVDVVSAGFKRLCENNNLDRVIFRQLPDDPGYYAISSDLVVRYDFEARGTRFLKWCDVCKQHCEVVGATPVYLRHPVPLPPRSFARSDLEFAARDEKSPLLLCGVEAGEILKTGGLHGLEIEPIEHPDVLKARFPRPTDAQEPT